MTQQQKVLLLVLGGATVLGGVGWYVYSQQQKRRTIGISPQRAAELFREQMRMGPGQIIAARQQLDPSVLEGMTAARQRLFSSQG